MRTIKPKKDSLKLVKDVLNYLKASPYLWIGAYILPKGGVNEIESILENSGFNRIKMVKRCKKNEDHTR